LNIESGPIGHYQSLRCHVHTFWRSISDAGIYPVGWQTRNRLGDYPIIRRGNPRSVTLILKAPAVSGRPKTS